MKIAVAILPNGMVNAHLGHAKKIAFATVENKQIVGWEEVDVPFSVEHDHHHHHDHHHYDHHHHHDHHHDHHGHHHHHSGHHEPLKDFMVENGVDYILVEHIGPGMKAVFDHTDVKMVLIEDIKGKAKEVVQRFIDQGIVDYT